MLYFTKKNPVGLPFVAYTTSSSSSVNFLIGSLFFFADVAHSVNSLTSATSIQLCLWAGYSSFWLVGNCYLSSSFLLYPYFSFKFSCTKSLTILSFSLSYSSRFLIFRLNTPMQSCASTSFLIIRSSHSWHSIFTFKHLSLKCYVISS